MVTLGGHRRFRRVDVEQVVARVENGVGTTGER
ncbi:MAG: hypothetical protein ACRD2W_03735 [Acidimicrobiales bacterium]